LSAWSSSHPPLAVSIYKVQEDIDMNGWNKLLAALDATFGLSNKAASKVKKLKQGFDNKTQEHVIWLEYRVRVNDAQPPKLEPSLVNAGKARQMALMRELLAQDGRSGSPA